LLPSGLMQLGLTKVPSVIYLAHFTSFNCSASIIADNKECCP